MLIAIVMISIVLVSGCTGGSETNNQDSTQTSITEKIIGNRVELLEYSDIEPINAEWIPNETNNTRETLTFTFNVNANQSFVEQTCFLYLRAMKSRQYGFAQLGAGDIFKINSNGEYIAYANGVSKNYCTYYYSLYCNSVKIIEFAKAGGTCKD